MAFENKGRGWNGAAAINGTFPIRWFPIGLRDRFENIFIFFAFTT